VTSALDVGLYPGSAARTRVRPALEARNRGPHRWACSGESAEPTLDAAMAG